FVEKLLVSRRREVMPSDPLQPSLLFPNGREELLVSNRETRHMNRAITLAIEVRHRLLIGIGGNPMLRFPPIATSLAPYTSESSLVVLAIARHLDQPIALGYQEIELMLVIGG